VKLLRERERLLKAVAATLRTRPEDAPEAARAGELERRRLEKALRAGAGVAGGPTVEVEALAARAEEIAGASVLTAAVDVPDAKGLLELMDRLKGKLPDAAIVLGTGADGRAHLVASVAPALVQRGLRAGEIVKAAAAVVGGGGGGRDTLAQAGGRDPKRIGEAITAAQSAIETALRG
jgi:alanyl-tRNA synthetase